MNRQHTVAKPIQMSGTGLHSGNPVSMTIKPAAANTGIVFRRMDVAKHRDVPARYDRVVDTRLCTRLENPQGVSVGTVEHLMAALWGAGVDNAIIELDAPEVPIMDGSSEPFLAALQAVGTRAQDASRRIIRVLKDVEIQVGNSYARVSPAEIEGGFTMDVMIDYNHPVITAMRKTYDFSRASFGALLSRARTFGFAQEVEALQAAGLARGGSLANAIVVGNDGILNREGLRYSDEFIRHKALDCVGDLFLAGARIEGAFTFERPGHGVNNQLLRTLLADASAWKLVTLDAPRASAHSELRVSA